MPTFFFNLKTAHGEIRDPDGTELADELTAQLHARQVARELMRWRKSQSRSWRIDVRDGDGQRCFEVLFASDDDSTAMPGSELRGLIENLRRKQASLTDAISTVRLSIKQLQAKIARSKGRPYLVSVDGVSIAAGERAHQYSCGGVDVMVTGERPEIAENPRCLQASCQRPTRSHSAIAASGED